MKLEFDLHDDYVRSILAPTLLYTWYLSVAISSSLWESCSHSGAPTLGMGWGLGVGEMGMGWGFGVGDGRGGGNPVGWFSHISIIGSLFCRFNASLNCTLNLLIKYIEKPYIDSYL